MSPWQEIIFLQLSAVFPYENLEAAHLSILKISIYELFNQVRLLKISQIQTTQRDIWGIFLRKTTSVCF